MIRPPPHKEFDWSYWAVPIKASLIGTVPFAILVWMFFWK